MPTLDVSAARDATPGCAATSGHPAVAFLNNAGSSLPTQRTLDALTLHLHAESRVGGYEAHADAQPVLDGARASAARLLNANGPDEIAFAPSDTAAFTKIFWGLVNGEQIVEGDRVVVDRLNYNSHYLALLQAQVRLGLHIDVLPSLADGSIDLDDVDSVLDDDVALVSATMVGTHSGVVNPVAALGAACRRRGILFILDACQAVGQMPVDVAAIGCDALTTTGRKWLRAPRGTGFLWVHRDVVSSCSPLGIDGHAATWLGESSYELAPYASRFEEFEASIAAQIGLAAALTQLEELGVDAVHDRVVQLAIRLRRELADRPGVVVREPLDCPSGIVTFTPGSADPVSVAGAARAAGISISTSSTPWARLDMEAKGLASVVRVSPHYYNTDEELDRLLAVIEREVR